MGLLFSERYLPPLKQKDTVESCSTCDPAFSLLFFFCKTAECPVVPAQVQSFTLNISIESLALGGFVVVGVYVNFFSL